jgi:CxxC motif-containing protein (DUF1111 family)
MITSFGSARGVCLASAVVVLAMLSVESGVADEKSPPNSPASAINGQALFAREWIPGDKRSHGGDGLGPMFNDSSCVACHNLGGIGGGGPSDKNVDIVTAFKNNQQQHAGNARPPATLPEAFVRSLFGTLDAPREVPKPESPAKESPEDRAAKEKARLEKVKAQQDAERQELGKLHPGFLAGSSVVLHQNATYTGYDAWRARMAGLHFGGAMSGTASELKFFSPQDAANSTADQRRLGLRPDSTQSVGSLEATQGQVTLQQLHNEVQFAQHAALNSSTQHGNFAVVRSQRNTTALFGAGKIDAIPVAFLEELERKQAEKKEVSGRVARLKDGSAGRFGWKAQTPTLRDFVLTACAVELGLNVPGHPQAGVPQKPDYAAPGLDLNAAECDALIRYVHDLPAPTQRELSDPTDAAYVLAGNKLFDSVGCAACHVANVGEAKGIFSDLLVHDMGPELGDTGSYGVFVPDSTPEGQAVPIGDFAESQRSPLPQEVTGPDPDDEPNSRATSQRSPQPQEVSGPVIGATRQEWRTPPLWGVRDSTPYLHDGRARTLEQAIALHGGESAKSAQKYFALSPAERFQVVTFLKSLVAPDQVASSR